GIGIFPSPPLVASTVYSELAFMGVWLLGGFVTLIAAHCSAEVGSSHPSSAGEYHFLSRAYGRTVGLLFAWARGTVIQTGAIAAVAFVFGDYAQQLLPLGEHGASIHAGIVVLAITGLNLLGTPQSKMSQIVLTLLSLLAIVVVIIAGSIAGAGIMPEMPSAAAEPSGGALGMAMVFVLLTYGGWSEAAYLSGELRNVQRNMVRALVGGTLIITLSYLLVNLAYLNVFGLEELRRTDVPAADLMRLAMGET